MKIQQVPEFEEAAFSAPLNKVVRCKTNFGWHLLQVLSERYFRSKHMFSKLDGKRVSFRPNLKFIQYFVKA